MFVSNSKFYFQDKSCEHGRLDVVNHLLNESVDLTTVGATALWHAANNGHLGVVERLLQIDNVSENIENPSPDGTTPLIMAIVKKYENIIKCFEKCVGRDKIVTESARFGRIHDVDNKEIMRSLQSEAMSNAVLSGRQEVVKHLTDITVNCSEAKPVLVKLDNENKILKQKHSALMEFSKEFPLFNEQEIEGKEETWFDQKPYGFYDSYDIPWPKICCFKNQKKTKKNIYIQDIKHYKKCSK